MDNSLSAFIKNTGDSLLKNEKLPGIFVGVLDNGTRSFYNFGFADPDKQMPFDSATLFEIASITKTFTAFVLEKVLLEKHISDTTSIINYLPDSVKQNKALEPVTFLRLMNHTSGLPRLPENMDIKTFNMTPYDSYSPDMLFSYLKTSKPGYMGNQVLYSNLGAGLAGLLAQRISGKSYFELVDKYIFGPFKLGKADKDYKNIANKAQGYFKNEKSTYWSMNALGPTYIIKSSADEMLSYLQYMSTPTGSDKAFVDQLLQPSAIYAPGSHISRAWFTVEQEGKPTIYWHNGGSYGFSSFGGFIPGKNKAVIVVVNKFGQNGTSDGLGIAILDKLIN